MKAEKVEYVEYIKIVHGKEEVNIGGVMCTIQCTETGDATAEVATLRALLLECANEIESHVKAEYGWPDVHPAQQSKFDAGMSLVNEAREAAKGGKP